MDERDPAFRFEYDPGVINYGDGCVADLSAELDRQGHERALVVCGQTVGATPAVIDPIEAGLGDRLAGTFAETTPAKRLDTAIEGAATMREVNADAIVAVGGGSSLDVARVLSIVAASDSQPTSLGETLETTGTLPVPDGDLPPVFGVPTTLAGADLSILAGITATPESGLVDRPTSGGVGHSRLMPAALFYDPALVATTPRDVLAASAMNGFDKGIETLYAKTATPITDGTAVRGLSLLAEGLPTLAAERDEWAIEDILRGTILVQYGISRPGETTLSLLHAFGHGLKAHTDIQQGAAHAIVAPPALTYLFEEVDGRRDLLAAAFGLDATAHSGDKLATATVDAVREVRDALGLPTRLRDVEGLDQGMLDDIATTTAEDSLLGYAPAGLDPTVADLRAVLESAW